MDRSRYLAALIGPTLAAVGLSLLLNPGLAAAMVAGLANDLALIVIAGAITLPVGLAIVLSHNVWKGWPVVITVFGWLAVLGGAARILFPVQIAAVAPDLLTRCPACIPVAAGVVLVLGGFLSLMAFRPRPAA